ncbi:hypothetical protein O3M35_001188 [Rhynocoris fuscipes]|uniref:DNA 3'-5' helicase n=1 Tax=Rhynocoris fuscipes TaxID=488301 RepID=A0AAW1DT32_9HEMI
MFQEKYEKLVHGKEMVESSLHRHLIEHLNAEIVLGTITDIAVAMNWIRSTYLYVRALKNPKHYGIPIGLTSKEVEARLQDMCLRELHALENHQLVITSDLAYNVEATENGKLMAKYYIAFDTMKIFMMVKGTENLAEMLELLSQCHEFDDVQLRTNEKACLNLMNNQKEQEIIRFCLEGKIKTRQMKTNCLIQSVLGCMQISDPSLRQESVKIIRLAQRLLNGLSLYLWPKNFYQALASALILNKCVHARLWENSPFVCRQLPGIGSVLAAQLVSAKKNTFQSILESNPRDLERVLSIFNINNSYLNIEYSFSARNCFYNKKKLIRFPKKKKNRFMNKRNRRVCSLFFVQHRKIEFLLVAYEESVFYNLIFFIIN